MGIDNLRDSINYIFKENTNLNIIWLDKNINSKENIVYQNEIKSEISYLYNLKFYPLDLLDDTISILKEIEFTKTIIIVSGKYYEDFIEKLYSIKNEIYFKDNIVVFCGSKRGFLYWCEINNIYVNECLVFDKFENLLNYLKEQKIIIDEEYSFDIIKNNNELILPLLYQDFFEPPSNESIYLFHNLLKDYYKDDINIYSLLEQIDDVYDLNTLCKFWIRIYTEDSNFYREMNSNLRKKQKIYQYMTFIKLFYQGIKLNIFTPVIDKLYRGSTMSKKEFENFKKCEDKKLKDNSIKIIMYSITFLSFSKRKCVAEQFFLNEKEEKIKILFEVIPSDNIDDDNEKLSNIDVNIKTAKKYEQEVLFGPFSAFEFISFEDISNKDFYSNNTYYIKLNYLGKYRKELFSEFNKDKILDFIPPTKYSLELIELGFIKLNLRLIWSKIKTIKLKISYLLYKKDIIICSAKNSIIILNNNYEVIKNIHLFDEDEVILGIGKINESFYSYSKKCLKIFKVEKSNQYQIKTIHKINLLNRTIESILFLSDFSLLISTSDFKLQIYDKKNNVYKLKLSVTTGKNLILSMIELSDYHSINNNNQIKYFASLSEFGELTFWNSKLVYIDKLRLSDKPNEYNLCLFKKYLIILFSSSISLINYETKEEICFSLEYQTICYNKLNENSFLISMKSNDNKYFFNEYQFSVDNNEINIEYLGNSNLEEEKILNTIKINNNEIIEINQNEIVHWKKNRIIKQHIAERKYLEKKEKKEKYFEFLESSIYSISKSFLGESKIEYTLKKLNENQKKIEVESTTLNEKDDKKYKEEVKSFQNNFFPDAYSSINLKSKLGDKTVIENKIKI